eukprot:1242557-Amorphochlora_amoeboformis.AAC.1
MAQVAGGEASSPKAPDTQRKNTPWAQGASIVAMTAVYFFTPILIGYRLMLWTNNYADKHARKRIEELRDESAARQRRVEEVIETDERT